MVLLRDEILQWLQALTPEQRQQIRSFFDYIRTTYSPRISFDNESFVTPDRLVSYLREKAPDQLERSTHVLVHFATSTVIQFNDEHNHSSVACDISLIQFVNKRTRYASFYHMPDFRKDHSHTKFKAICGFIPQNSYPVMQSLLEEEVLTMPIDLSRRQRSYMLQPSTLKRKTQELILTKVAADKPMTGVCICDYEGPPTIRARIRNIARELLVNELRN